MKRKVLYGTAEAAGMKLLAFAIKRNVERVERRYRNAETRMLCQVMANVADTIIEHVENQRAFTVYVAHQAPIPDFFETDDWYARVE